MEVYKTPSKESQDILLASVVCSEVIEGLNRYFASEPRNNYISIWPTVNKRDFVLYEPEAWADILIEWLRKKHDIFYRPGMTPDQVEAARSAAKMCCLRESIKAALRKRGISCKGDADIPELVDTLFEAYDECGERADKNRKYTAKLSEEIRCVVNEKESAIENLKDRIAELESNFKAVCDEDDIFRTRALKAEEEVRKLKTELNAIKDTVSQARSRLNSKFVSLPGYENDLVKLADIALRAVDARDETISRINVTAQKEAKQECYEYLWDRLRVLSPDCDALKITDYEELVEGKCKECRRKQSTEKFDYIQRTNKAEEEVKKLKEQLDKAAADYQALSEENQKLKSAEKADTNKLIRNYCTEHGIVAPSRYLSDEACIEYLFSVSVAILQDLYRDIFKKQPNGLSAKDIATKILDRVLETEDEIENLRGQISRLKDLINAMNEEVGDM